MRFDPARSTPGDALTAVATIMNDPCPYSTNCCR